MMMENLVRICPVCEAENPPERVYCHICASSLADVDFRPRLKAPPTEPPATAKEIATGEENAPPPEEAAPGKILEALTTPAPPAASGEESLICPAPDCGQPNPPDSARCRYCNTLLPSSREAAGETPGPPLSASRSPAPFELAPPELDHVPAGAFPMPETAPRVLLPRRLAARFRVIRELATGSESDLMIVTPVGDAAPQWVLKLYRRGIRPDTELFSRVRGAGPHVVQVIEHGEDEGLAWSLMEHCRAGNLRDFLRGRLIDWTLLARLAEELSAGVRELHARNILHRDLKPENVLIKETSPLRLALTDFGIAALFEGTRLFTDNARTVKYAAPEALTGVLDAKADWWSVGMILLEAASGKHPFDGLSEQVINHHLATRPVAVAGIMFPRMEKLCRGLLLRDPGRRWGAEEVARWLRDDSALPMPVESNAALARPFRLGKKEARNIEELAALYAAGPEAWQQGVRDLESGLIQLWIKEELCDFNLLRDIHDILGGRESAERKFLRFLYAAAPDLPPCWRGRPLHVQGIAACARQACANAPEAKEARARLADLHENGVCSFFASRHAELGALGENWRQTLLAIHRIGEAAQKTGGDWAQKAIAGRNGVVHFNTLIYGPRNLVELPPSIMLNPYIVLALDGGTFLDALEKDVRNAAAELADEAPWFVELTRTAGTETIAERSARLIIAREMAGIVRDLMREVRKRREIEKENRLRHIVELRATVVDALQVFLRAEGKLDTAPEQIYSLRGMLTRLRERIQNIRGIGYTDAPFLRLSGQIDALESHGDMLEKALDNIEANRSAPSWLIRLLRRLMQRHGGRFALMEICLGLLFFLFLRGFAFSQSPFGNTPLWLLAALAAIGALIIIRARLRSRFLRRTARMRMLYFYRACKRFAQDEDVFPTNTAPPVP